MAERGSHTDSLPGEVAAGVACAEQDDAVRAETSGVAERGRFRDTAAPREGVDVAARGARFPFAAALVDQLVDAERAEPIGLPVGADAREGRGGVELLE